jgi:hypothetical protein
MGQRLHFLLADVCLSACLPALGIVADSGVDPGTASDPLPTSQ